MGGISTAKSRVGDEHINRTERVFRRSNGRNNLRLMGYITGHGDTADLRSQRLRRINVQIRNAALCTRTRRPPRQGSPNAAGSTRNYNRFP